MTALEAYILARAFTKQAIAGAGALKGAPCQIQSITPITGGNRITFAWETSEGETETDSLDVMDGVDGTNGTDGTDGTDGVGISSITFKEKDASGNNVYTVTLTNTNTYDITCPIGPQGETGATGATGATGNGIASITKTGTAGLVDTYTITYTNGTTSTFTVTNGETPTVDSAMSDSSTNPVQNKVIYDSEKDIYAAMGEMGAKNLIPYPYDRESGYSSQGATVTYDKNGVMTVNKVAGTDTAFFSLLSTVLNPNIKIVLKPNTRYILSLKLTNATNTSVAITKSTAGDIAAIRNKGTGYYETVFTTPADMSVLTGIILYWASDVTETNAIVEVMIRQANIIDNTYQPYAKTNKQLTDDVALLDSEKADTDIVASDFDATASYTAGDYCIYEGKFYKFKASHSGAWSAADVDEIKIAGELSALKSGLTNLIVSDIKSSVGQTVAAGDDTMFAIDVTKQGYTPIFYTAINTTNSRLVPYYYALSGNTLSVAVHNYATGSLDGAVSALVLYRHS